MSIGLSIKVYNADKVAAEIGKDIDKMVGEFTALVISIYREMFEGSRTGRLYRRGSFTRRHSKGFGQRASGPGTRIHRASAPGEPLARETGKTQRSTTVRRLKSGVYRIRFGGNVGYWEFRDAVSQRRPTIMPALEKAAEQYFG
jgi:hypothetical protein